jgi:hypothetical protein
MKIRNQIGNFISISIIYLSFSSLVGLFESFGDILLLTIGGCVGGGVCWLFNCACISRCNPYFFLLFLRIKFESI